MQSLRFSIPFPLLLVAAAAQAQQAPPPRTLGPVVATSSEAQMIAGVRVLASGEVLVNDPRSRRVLLFDPALTQFRVIADSTSATGNAYTAPFAGLIPFRGDSTLFVDPMSMSMLVLDPTGKVGRVMSVPRSQDAGAFAGGTGAAQYDPAGRLVYRSPPTFGGGARRPGAAGGGSIPGPEQSDTVPLVRVDLATRQLDTVAFIRVPRLNMRVTRSEAGTVTMESEINPLPLVDDWTLLPDGTIAIVRGADYRVDFIGPDGGTRSSARVPFEWQRLTDEDKVTFMDSVKVAFERRRAEGGIAGLGAAMGAGVGGGARVTFRDGPGGPAGPAPNVPREPQFTFIAPEQLPDYRPPFFVGAVRVDTDGNVWVRTTRSTSGGPIYDVIDRAGQLIDRVQVPEGRTIVGFAPGAVYLSSPDGSQTRLERALLR